MSNNMLFFHRILRIKDESEGEKRATALLMAIEDSDDNDISVLDNNHDNIEVMDSMKGRNVKSFDESSHRGDEGKQGQAGRETSTETGAGAGVGTGTGRGISLSGRIVEKWQMRRSINYDSDDDDSRDDEGEDNEEEEEDEEDELGDRGMTFIPLYQVSGMPIWMPSSLLSDKETERKREIVREVDIEAAVTVPFSIIELDAPKDNQNVPMMQSEGYRNNIDGSEENNRSNYYSKRDRRAHV